MLLTCCTQPEISKDAEFDSGDSSDNRTIRPAEDEPGNNVFGKTASGGEKGKQKGKGKGGEKGKDKGKGDSKGKGPQIELVDGLPMLPSQLEMMEGSWAWIRQSNSPHARTARLEAGKLLQEAFKRGGYAVKAGGKLHKTKFKHLADMLAGTKSISIKEGLPKIGADPKHTTKYEYGGHPIERAAEFTLEGFSTVTVNAASAYHAGGGFTTGGRHALEEAFCSQSTLYPSLEGVVAAMGAHDEGVPHIPVDGVILSPHVELFRRGSEQGYVVHPRVVKIAGVVSVALYNRNPQVKDSPLDAPKDKAAYERGVRDKLKAMVHAAILAGADAIIVPDVGCGVFHNDPDLVGRLAGQAISEYSSYFKRVLFTGKTEFFDAAAKVLMVSLMRTKEAAIAALKVADRRVCPICGKNLGAQFSELSLLLTPTGKRAEGLQFLHASCCDRISERWPDYTAMTLPAATSDPDSFLRALDVDGNGVLCRDEVFCAVSALWAGDPEKLKPEFDAKWALWDSNKSGDLDVHEIAELPQTFTAWLKESATVSAASNKR